MYNFKELLEHKRKILLILGLITVGVVATGISLFPVVNYVTGENITNRYAIPIVYVGFYTIIIGIIVGVFIGLGFFVGKKIYIVRTIDESIDGIKRGKVLQENTVSRRDEILQTHFAECMHASGLKAKITLFDGMSQVEHDEIRTYRVDDDAR